MTLQYRIRIARALELAEHRRERLELKLEQMSKEMRIASRAFERFNRAVRKFPAEDKMFDEDPMEIDENVACENKADDGEPCGNVGRYYPDHQMYLCDDCAEENDATAR